jgi:hypothetical protein
MHITLLGVLIILGIIVAIVWLIGHIRSGR